MASSVPGAVGALITILTAALPGDATVWFGKALPVYTAPLTLQILKVSGDQEPAELGPSYRREETFSIHCELTSFAGDQDCSSGRRLRLQHRLSGHAERHDENHLAEFHNSPFG